MIQSTEDNGLQKCYLHLVELLNSKDVEKFNLEYFEAVKQNQFDDSSDLIQQCSILLLQLLDHCKKQFKLCSDVAYVFCLISSFRYNSSLQLYSDFIKLPESTTDTTFCENQLLHSLLEKNAVILVLGMLKYLIFQEYKFHDSAEFRYFNTKIKKIVFLQLTCQNDANTLLQIAGFWLILVENCLYSSLDTLEEVLVSVVSVVMNFWNYHISEIRIRVKRLLLKCLNLNFVECLKQKRYESKLVVALDMKLIRIFTTDMFWSVPYKYFAYLVGLEFISGFSSVSKFLKYMQDDVREGFYRTLTNTRVLGIETDLFKFCTNNLSFENWKGLFHPLIKNILSAESIVVATNFSRYLLPSILRRFPEYSEILYSSIPSNAGERTVLHSKILFALLRICHSRRIRLLPGAHFLLDLECYLSDAEEARGELFALLCSLNDQSVLHSEEELKLIFRFLKINAHSSSPILRQQIFSSFAVVVLRLICSCVKILKTSKEDAEFKLMHIFVFLKEFNDFFLNGIEPGSSYQRIITALMLYKIFMTYAIRDCGGEMRRNNLKDAESFVNFAKEHGWWHFTKKRNFEGLFRCLMDPCSEIQNLAFVLLRTYFDLSEVGDERVILFSNASKSLDDNQFYRRQSGIVTVLSCICLCYNSGQDVPNELLKELNQTCSSFTEMFFNILVNQFEIMKFDILNSALYHPLDATIKILTYLMTDVSSPERSIISKNQIERMIGILEQIVPLLLEALFIDKSADYAPSFEESDVALQTIIEKSETVCNLKIQNSREDEFQLKPVYQILLNFIWISLKVCCECESSLVVNQTNQLNEIALIRCCNLIVKKLKLCRHKGVVEAAGIAMSNVVQTLTNNNLCEQWLDSILSDIIYLIEHKRASTISRKSAGLSLLIQNIIGNDKRPKKPSLVKCFKEFRRILNLKNYDILHANVSQELPQTHALHFLKVLVSDARNSVDLSPYFEEITLLCIQTLNVPIWTVRNASLQLFGAILPKLVGQKNFQNDFAVRRSFEEVFLSMPKLLNYVVYTFEKSNIAIPSKKLTAHSNLVPLLVMLSNMQVSSVSMMEEHLFSKLLVLRVYTKALLKSELHFVRELAGKAFTSLHSANEINVFSDINNDVVKHIMLGNLDQNFLHGNLLLLKHAFSLYSELSTFQKYIAGNRLSLAVGLFDLKISLPCQTFLYDLKIGHLNHLDWNVAWKVIMEYISSVLDNLSSYKHVLLGYDEWTYTLVNITFINCQNSLETLSKLVKYCLQTSHVSILESILKVLTDSVVPEKILEYVFTELCDCMRVYLRSNNCPNKVSVLNRLFIVLINLSTPAVVIEPETLKHDCILLIKLNHHEYQALNLQVLCLLIFLNQDRLVTLRSISVFEEIRRTSDVVRFNKDMRLNSAKAMLLLVNCSHLLNVNSKIVWTILTDFLQDEESEIRLIGCECFRKLSKRTLPCNNPDETLCRMFSLKFMKLQFPMETVIQLLWERLIVTNFEDVHIKNEITNPFDQGIGNTYKEEVKIVSLAGNNLLQIIIDENSLVFYSSYIMYYQKHIEDMLNTCKKILKNKFLISALSYTVAMKCYYLFSLLCNIIERRKFLSCEYNEVVWQLLKRKTEILECNLSLRLNFYFSEVRYT